MALLADLGVTAYRFSIAWSRVLPDGDGAVNPAGLGFYDRLVDELLARGIAPWPTLYHWDLPAALEDRGGWLDRSTVDAFARYAEVMAGALGDRVEHWITHNEPWVASYLGYRDGVFPPGHTDWGTALIAGHHLLLSHGRAVPAIRAAAPGARVGIALDCRPSAPASGDPEDRDAQRYFDGMRNRWFFDPVFGLGYPEDMVVDYAERGHLPDAGMAFDRPGDAAEIGAPLDFLGINFYSSLAVSADNADNEDTGVPPGADPPPGHTEMGWAITPAALPDFLRRVHADYDPPQIVITENGASFSDGPDSEGRIRDERRIAYLDAHLRALAEAVADGVPVGGYLQWSLLDNLEWNHGFSQRFGLVWVDFTTQQRLPKDSYQWYREVIARNGLA